MRRLIVSEFISLDGVIQAPGGEDARIAAAEIGRASCRERVFITV